MFRQTGSNISSNVNTAVIYCCGGDDQTYPFVDVHLQRVVVEREEMCVRAAGCIALTILQPGTQTHVKSQVEAPTLCVNSNNQKTIIALCFRISSKERNILNVAYKPFQYWFY